MVLFGRATLRPRTTHYSTVRGAAGYFSPDILLLPRVLVDKRRLEMITNTLIRLIVFNYLGRKKIYLFRGDNVHYLLQGVKNYVKRI